MRDRWIFIGVVIFSLFLAVLRVAGEKSELFQAAAHLWTGGLFVAGYGLSHKYLGVAVAISIVELMVFLQSLRPG